MVKKGINLKSIFKSPFRVFASSKAKLQKKAINSSKEFTLSSIWNNRELRRKILFTLGLILVFRILASIPLPGIDVSVYNQVFGNNPASNFFTMVTGGRLDNPSVVAIGLGAYINASVILQLLQTVIPKLEELSKEGERGRRVINQYTRLLAIPLNIVQAIVVYAILKNAATSQTSLAGLLANVTTLDVVTMVVSLTAGSMVLMWLGELITEKGIGNGTSMIIAIGILAGLPALVSKDFSYIIPDLQLLLKNGNFGVLVNDNFILLYAVLIGLCIIVWSIVHITEATRKIAIQYANRVRSTQSGNSSYLPLKINQAGVMPVIFASALLSFPQIFASLLIGIQDQNSFLYKVGNWLNNSPFGSNGAQGSGVIYYEMTYFVLIIVFAFFYTFVTFKPSETAENLKKSAGFIPGIRPGKETEAHITFILIRLTFVGSIFLAAIALIPSVVRLFPQGATLNSVRMIGGTSVLIVVGTVIDTIRQMKSVSVSKSYDQFK